MFATEKRQQIICMEPMPFTSRRKMQSFAKYKLMALFGNNKKPLRREAPHETRVKDKLRL